MDIQKIGSELDRLRAEAYRKADALSKNPDNVTAIFYEGRGAAYAHAWQILMTAAVTQSANRDRCEQHNVCEHQITLTAEIDGPVFAVLIRDNWGTVEQQAVAVKAAAMGISLFATRLLELIGSESRIDYSLTKKGGE